MIVRLLDRTPAWALWVFVILMTSLGVIGYWVQTSSNADQSLQITHQQKVLTTQSRSIGALAAAVAEANRRLASHGQTPVPVPPTPSSTSKPVPPQVIIERPSAASVAAAVHRYCATGACRGRGVTTTQIRAAVTAYCADGRCIGAPGADGQNGTPGTDGAPGPAGTPGPGPTDEQVAAAVASYCGSGSSCEGRGIVSMTCSILGPLGFQIVVTYTDGTTETVDCATTTPATVD